MTLVDEGKWYTTTEVAETLSVTAETVRNWINSGRLPATKFGEGKKAQWRVARADFLKFARSNYKSE